MKKIFIQIGTNNGDDDFCLLCHKHKPSMIILVEPSSKHNKSIEKYYKGLDNVFIENIAISDIEKADVTLVIPKNRPDMWNDCHFSLIPMNDWGNDFEEMTVPALTFMQLCKKYNVTYVDYLQIDTEGFDTEIIKSIDFKLIDIHKIRYEKWTFPTEVFSRHGEKGKLYGVKGMQVAGDLLKSNSYILVEEIFDILAIKV